MLKGGTMTIDEAIKLLEVAKEGWPLIDQEKYYTALELGIEALKRIKLRRDQGKGYEPKLLLGETEE